MDDTLIVIIILVIILVIILQPEYSQVAIAAGFIVALLRWAMDSDWSDTWTDGFRGTRERLDAGTAPVSDSSSPAAPTPDVSGTADSSDIVQSDDATTSETALSQAAITAQVDSSDAVDRVIDTMLFGKPVSPDGTKPVDADDMLAYQMKAIGGKSQEATLNRTRYTSDNFRRFLQEELDEEERRVWWEADMLDDEMTRDETVTQLPSDIDQDLLTQM